MLFVRLGDRYRKALLPQNRVLPARSSSQQSQRAVTGVALALSFARWLAIVPATTSTVGSCGAAVAPEG